MKTKLPVWCLFIFYYISCAFLKVRVKRYVRKYKLKDASNLNIQIHKRSDTLFILGSGASIVNISPEEWEIIRKSNSFGFNKWIIHDFVPTFYMFEHGAQTDIFCKNLTLKAEKYKRVPIIYKGFIIQPLDLDKFPLQLRQNLYISSLFLIAGRDVTELHKVIQYMDKFGMFSCSKRFKVHAHRRATLSNLIIFGVVGGYKNIVLCGVDLNNIDYFYQMNSEYYKKKGLLIPCSGQQGSVHKTFDKNVDPVAMDEVIYALNDLILKPRGINLYVAFSSSALYPRIPLYFRKL